MSSPSTNQIRSRTEMVKKIFNYHFGKLPKNILFKQTGQTNFVFETISSAGNFIIHIEIQKIKSTIIRKNNGL